MKKNLPLSLSNAFMISLCFGFSLNAVSQELEQKVSSQKNEIAKKIKLDESKVVSFPIKSKTTTDSNFEVNKKKSKEVQSNLNNPSVVIVKDDKYYSNRIKVVKARIDEIQANANSAKVNADKLVGLTEKLALLEQEYVEFKKN